MNEKAGRSEICCGIKAIVRCSYLHYIEAVLVHTEVEFSGLDKAVLGGISSGQLCEAVN